MQPVPDHSHLLERLQSDQEETRYHAMVEMRDAVLEQKLELTPALMRQLQSMEEDTSRPVRQLARELFLLHAPSVLGEEARPPEQVAAEQYPGSMLLALCAWGSALTGIIGTGMSLLSYYLLGRFPFPGAIDVLFAANLFLTLPYLIEGLLLLFPGRFQKQLALYYAYFSLLLCLVLIGGLQYVFEASWAIQLTQADQRTFRVFLSPFQLTTAFLPVIAGQAMLLYYLSQYLAPGRADVDRKRVDTRS